MNNNKVVIFKNHSYKNNNNNQINGKNNSIDQNKIQISDFDEKIEQNFSVDDLQKAEKNKKREDHKEEQEEKPSKYMKDNTKLRDIIENAIFS